MCLRKLLFCFLMLVGTETHAQDRSFTVMAWNILHGANDIDNGKENAIKIIKEIDPDVILMVETYGSGLSIAQSLGYNFHLIAPEGTALDDKNVNLSIFSKYPFGDRIDTEYPFYLGGIEILIHNKKIRFFSNWFHYLPWDDEPEKMGKSSEELLAWERTGQKYEMIQKVLPYLEKFSDETDSIPMIFGGDMNTPSHKDWGEQTKHLHNGLVVPWYSTKVLEDLGLIDSFRKINPDPISYPGITWDTKGINDSHRIDYIFYKGNSIEAIKSDSYKAFLNEPFSINNKEFNYPSDHGFVVTVFEIK
ncbi:endonuclease/exonuclease/phosphatase family protein [Algoriphagus aquimarinus]|uniref:Endonuclease/exonuclease/phosphatase family protein n=1 Tax=Algoriphagus aquimarinus TaxID=237018 RepID=A0A5C7ACK1_9BACT|nr:endonuclease/exonuclease/phosphatase family protein [Algoriphagus aquimarinus]TXE05917.1 endonuclease/exonuclease/phosphatase family protein [Algoriphagus aquimarinus]